MKRIAISLLAALCSVVIWAAPPKLACESLFNRDRLSDDITKLVINTSGERYYRNISFEKNPAMVKKVKTFLEKDRKLASNVFENYSKEKNNIILNVPNNNQIINIGFSWSDDGDGMLFVEGPADAFK